MKHPNITQSYQIIDRIGFVKRMISTHQKKLATEPKRCSSHLETSQTENQIKRTRGSTSNSEYTTESTNISKILREELRLTKTLLEKRTYELGQLQNDNKLLQSQITRLNEDNEQLRYNLKKLGRERDDLKDDLGYKMKKIDLMQEEMDRFEKNHNQMLVDLNEARSCVQNIKHYEIELKQKEKELLIDWQKIEKEKTSLKDKQNKLLVAEEQLSNQANNLQLLKNRMTIQEKRLLDDAQEKKNQLNLKEQQLDLKEKTIGFKEINYQSQQIQREEVEQKEKILNLNEELWKKKVQSEFCRIKEIQTKLRIIK